MNCNTGLYSYYLRLWMTKNHQILLISPSDVLDDLIPIDLIIDLIFVSNIRMLNATIRLKVLCIYTENMKLAEEVNLKQIYIKLNK